MSDELFSQFDDDETNDGGQNQKPSGLRAYAEAQAKENKDLRERLATLENENRRSALARALDSAGKDPAAASLIPADVEPDGVTKWLEEHGRLIADKQAGSPEGEQQGQEQQTPETPPLTEEQRNLAAAQGAPSGAVPPTVSSPELDDLRQATSREDFYERLSKANRTA